MAIRNIRLLEDDPIEVAHAQALIGEHLSIFGNHDANAFLNNDSIEEN